MIKKEQMFTTRRVRATAKGLESVGTLSHTIEAHYRWMERRLGKDKLQQLYALLDEVIALDAEA
jgi:hypothetical protein